MTCTRCQQHGQHPLPKVFRPCRAHNCGSPPPPRVDGQNACASPCAHANRLAPPALERRLVPVTAGPRASLRALLRPQRARRPSQGDFCPLLACRALCTPPSPPPAIFSLPPLSCSACACVALCGSSLPPAVCVPLTARCAELSALVGCLPSSLASIDSFVFPHYSLRHRLRRDLPSPIPAPLSCPRPPSPSLFPMLFQPIEAALCSLRLSH
eukprot:6208849-Pleurochrysis_carterae.AAC.4